MTNRVYSWLREWCVVLLFLFQSGLMSIAGVAALSQEQKQGYLHTASWLLFVLAALWAWAAYLAYREVKNESHT